MYMCAKYMNVDCQIYLFIFINTHERKDGVKVQYNNLQREKGVLTNRLIKGKHCAQQKHYDKTASSLNSEDSETAPFHDNVIYISEFKHRSCQRKQKSATWSLGDEC